MSAKHKHRCKEKREDLHDLELQVEGRIVKTNTGLLSYSSSVFATLISNARATKEAGDNDVIDLIRRQRSPDRHKIKSILKLEIPNMKYKDVKTLVECLQVTEGNKCELTCEKALRILPLVDHFRMPNLKKSCKAVLSDSLAKKQREHGVGKLETKDVLKFLGAADTYNFESIRRKCIEELTHHTEATDRREIMQDKHVTEKTKLKIMDKLCDAMSQDYEHRLKQIRYDMDRRCRQIEQRRDEFMEQLETWKGSLKEEVDKEIKTSETAHKKLVEDLQQKKIVDKIDGNLKQTKEELFNEMKQLKDQLTFVFETMESNEVIGDMEAQSLRETLEEAIKSNTRNIENITVKFKTKLEESLKICSFDEIESGVASGYELEEKVSRTIEELEANALEMAAHQVKFEEEKLAHERTRSLMMKLKIREHEINTWLKWAKPVSEDEEKCMCFRHSVNRK